jgi:hypothetical protein
VQEINLDHLRWRQSQASGGTNCVQVARSDEGVFVRDSKALLGPALSFTCGGWQVFIDAIKLDTLVADTDA